VLEIIGIFRYGINRLKSKGKRALIIYTVSLVLGIVLDGGGVLYASKAINSWSKNSISNSSVDGHHILLVIITAMLFFVTRGLLVGFASIAAMKSLARDETRVAVENWEAFQRKSWNDRRSEQVSSLLVLLQDSPQALIQNTIFNAITIITEIINVLIVLLVLTFISFPVAVGTLCFFLLLGLLQNKYLSKLSSRIGDRRRDSLSEMYDGTALAFRLSKTFSVMPSQTFGEHLYQKRFGLSNSLVDTKLIQLFPRYSLEIALMVGSGFIVAASYVFGDGSQMTANLVLFLLAGFRIVPIASHIQSLVSAMLTETPFIKMEQQLLPRIEASVQAGNLGHHEFTVRPSEFPPKLLIESASYAYPNSVDYAVDGISTIFETGKVYAIVGANGAGKSTLMDLILGLIEPVEGKLIWTGIGQPVLAYVPQVSDVFKGNFSENLTLEWNTDYVDAQSLESALNLIRRAYGEDEKISTMEDLTSLSGGQKQFVTFLRALYRKPEILVLDEATSSLDDKTEELINQICASYAPHTCTIVVAHRRSSILAADEIIYLRGGKLAAAGTLEQVSKQIPEFLVNLPADR